MGQIKYSTGIDGLEPLSSPAQDIDTVVTEDAIRVLLQRHISEAETEHRRAERVRRRDRLLDEVRLRQDDTVDPHSGSEEVVQTRPDAETETETETGDAADTDPAPRKPRRGILSYQPRTSHTLLVMALTVTLAKPWLIPAALAAAIFTTVVAYLTMGHDRSVELVLQWYAQLERHRPDLAEKLRLRAARWSRWAGGKLSNLPEKWVEGLYLPDFEEPDELPEKMQQDPFERLKQRLQDV